MPRDFEEGVRGGIMKLSLMHRETFEETLSSFRKVCARLGKKIK
jgi:hypothetical protein